MFDIGWTEMMVVAVVAILFVGPKELPGMLRTFGRSVKKLRAMAGDFQRQFDDALKEAELDGVKDTINEVRNLNPANKIKDHLNPIKQDLTDAKELVEEAADFDPHSFSDSYPSKAASSKSDAPKPTANGKSSDSQAATKVEKPAPAKKSATKRIAGKPTAKKASATKSAAAKSKAKTASKSNSTARSTASSAKSATSTGRSAKSKTTPAKTAQAKASTAKAPKSTKTGTTARTSASGARKSRATAKTAEKADG
ncbi:MAG: Sec-independent protein translocase protein TatB [Ahrensia sp.]|nr:Sec-independent protein translocase protein TatB [Ahrensia sp.]